MTAYAPPSPSPRDHEQASLRDLLRNGMAEQLLARVQRDPACAGELIHAALDYQIELRLAARRAANAPPDPAIEQLRAERDEALRANRAKSDFLANMSHEIRTPIHTVIGFTKLVLEDHEAMQPGEVLGFLKRILEAAERQLFFVNDLLDLSKLEAGRIELRPSALELGALLRRCAEEFDPLLRGKHLDLHLQLPTAAAPVRADADRVAQIVRNLLANALRHAPADSAIELHLQADGDRWLIRVEDRGPGIPEGELESIFEKFVQSSTTGSGGTGLGLAIARALAELHGGSLQAYNREGGGAGFVLTLPGAG